MKRTTHARRSRQMLCFLSCIALFVSGSAQAKPRGKGGKATATPDRVQITLIGAQVAPGKSDGTQWDGTGKLKPEQVTKTQQLVQLAVQAAAAAANPPGAAMTAAAKLLGDLAMPAVAKPDVFGWVEWQPQGVGVTVRLDLAPRSKPIREYSVTWRNPVVLPSADWNSRMRMRITLRDKDVVNDDAIGTVELNTDHIRYAWSQQKVTSILVADQSTGQLLAVRISVQAVD